jgi:hypothetical protein
MREVCMRFTKSLLKVLPILICAMLILSVSDRAVGKHLVYAEWFIDIDPGLGQGDSIPPCDGTFNQAQEEFCINNVSVPDLPDGRHTFFLRLKDSENEWGTRQLDFHVVSSSPYVSKTITEAEYFIDSDPGEGNGTPLPAADGAFDESVEYLLAEGIESSSLSLGPHSLFVRVRNSYNVWSIPRKVNFNVIEANPYKTLETAEYFIDTDPGVGLGIALTASDGAFDESTEEAFKNGISTTSLSPGTHTVGVRFKDNWSYWPTFNGWGPTLDSILCIVEKPQILYPIDEQGTDSVTLKWISLESVDSYHIHVSNRTTFDDTLHFLSSPTESLTVTELQPDTCLWWRVRGVYQCGEGMWSDSGRYCILTDVRDIAEEETLPASCQLSQNYPNPFNPTTNIRFNLPKSGHVSLDIYNIIGRRVTTLADEYLCAGHKLVTWDGKDDSGKEVSSGVYFYKITAGDYSETKKMIFMK